MNSGMLALLGNGHEDAVVAGVVALHCEGLIPGVPEIGECFLNCLPFHYYKSYTALKLCMDD